MRKLLITVLAVAMAAAAAAQEKPGTATISLNIGGYPLMEGLEYGGMFTKADVELPLPTLSRLYRDDTGPMYSTGTIALQADFPMKKWLSVPLTLAGNLMWQRSTSLLDGSSHVTTNWTSQLLSGFRFKYMNREKVNFYSMLCVGVGTGTTDYMVETEINGVNHKKYGHTVDLIPAFQIVPFGVRFGGRVYGTAEIGFGSMYFGGMLGIGIRL